MSNNDSLRVLLIEDEDDHAYMIERLLRRAQSGVFHVHRVKLLKAGLQALSEKKYDVILLDLRLPDSDLHDTLERILLAAPAMPIIILSSIEDNHFARTQVHGGAQDYLCKSELSSQILSRSINYAVERKNAEEKIKSSELRKASIFQASLDGIISIDHHGKIIEFNRAAEQIFGYARSDVIGHSMAELIIPLRYRAAHFKGIAHYLASGKGTRLGKRLELTALRADGTEFPIELSIVVSDMQEGMPVFSGFLRDLTDVKRAEQNRETARKRLRMQFRVMSAMAESAAIEDAAPRILAVIGDELNWDMASLWRVDEAQTLLRTVHVWSAVGSEARELQDALESAVCVRGQELPGLAWQKNEALWVRDLSTELASSVRAELAARAGMRAAVAFPIRTGDDIVGMIELLSREQREADAELLPVFATTGGHIGQFIYRRAAESAMREAIIARDDFISLSSHELRTPITASLLQLKTAQRLLEAANSDQHTVEQRLRKAITVSTRQIETMAHLIDDLLDMSRINSGRLDMHFEEFDLADLVQDLCEQYAPTLADSGCDLQSEIQKGVTGLWDRMRMEQVLANLFSNVIKYAPGKRVKVKLASSRKTATLVVQDFGPGIPKEQQSRVFNRFERVKSLHTARGLGIGLFIVNQIVRAHQGSLQLHSNVGEGSMFSIVLPRRSAVLEGNDGIKW